MDYTSALDSLEGLSNALARHCAHHIKAGEILYAMAKVRESQKLLMVLNKAPGSLYFDSLTCKLDALHKYSRDPWKFLDDFIQVFRTLSQSLGYPLPLGLG